MNLAGEGVQERAAVVRQARLEAGGGVQGVRQLQELDRVESPTAGRPLDRRAYVMSSPNANAGPFDEQGPRLVRLIEGPGDDDRVRGRLQLAGEPARRRKRRLLGEPVADLRELEEGDRALVHVAQRPRAALDRMPGPETDG